MLASNSDDFNFEDKTNTPAVNGRTTISVLAWAEAPMASVAHTVQVTPYFILDKPGPTNDDTLDEKSPLFTILRGNDDDMLEPLVA